MANGNDHSKTPYELAGWNSGNANILVPNISLWDPTGMYEPVVEHLQLNPDPNGCDVYPGGKKKSGNTEVTFLRLQGFALEKLANMANIKWDPINSAVVEHTRQQYVRYRAVGYMHKIDGEPLVQAAYGEMDTDTLREDLTAEYIGKVRYDKKKSEKEKNEYVDYCVNRDLRQKRKFMIPLAESNAKNRVIRKLLNIQHEYHPDDIKKPFVVVWFRMSLDFNDPEIKRMVVQAKLAATIGLFGSRIGLSALPQSQQRALPQTVEEPPIDIPRNITPQEQPVPQTDDGGFTPPSDRDLFSDYDRGTKNSMLTSMLKIKGYVESDVLRTGTIESLKDTHVMAFYDKVRSLPQKEKEVAHA